MLQRMEELADRPMRPRLLLQSCCAPCSSHVLGELTRVFDVTLLYYNPNIYPPQEYRRRCDEQQRLLGEMPEAAGVSFIEGSYDPAEFYAAVSGLEELPEGSLRCRACYELRLRRTARLAKEMGFEFFTTTLSVSPHKNSEWINELGQALSAECGAEFLTSDFKKAEGYKHSLELSRQYGLYRQDYCGCVFSMRERDERAAAKAAD